MKMDQKGTATLLELAAKSLLSNEPAAIHALEELPQDLFVPLFGAAFLGGHTKVLKELVRVWPFYCLHIRMSFREKSSYEILEAMIDGLQTLPAQNSSLRSILRFVDMGCADYLEVKNADLSEVTTLFNEMIHLTSLCLFNIPFKSCKGRNFRNFLTWLGRLDNLQDISLSLFYLKNQLQKLLRVLPPDVDTFYLSSCDLSNRDVTALSQSPQAAHITLLDLSNNEIFSEAYGPFQTLLENVSGTLQHLQVNNCRITDSALSAVLPALSHCSHLRVLSFAHNPITMPMLMSLLQQLTSLMELKHVIYPVPVHCYEQRASRSRLNWQKFAEVQAQVKVMLLAVQRDDMNWTTSHE